LKQNSIAHVERFAEYIKTETLAESITKGNIENGFKQEVEIGEFVGTLTISKK
jgi:hypothetical protein